MFRRILMSFWLSLALLTPAFSEGRSIIVLDASGSMWGQIDGQTKIDLARTALADVVGKIPAENEIGLMAYGHREKGSCTDIELIVPPAAGTGQQIIDAANKLKFLGKTPLTEAVRRAAEAMRSTEEKATVILITDGIETCEADPCALGAELENTGVDFTAHVVGFGLTAEEGKQVACLAENTGGQYIAASDLDSLTLALETTVILPAEPEPAPEPEPVTPAAPAALEVNFIPTVVLAPGIPKPDDGADIAWELYTIAANGDTGERLWTEYNDLKTKVGPGTYRLLTTVGNATVAKDLTFTEDQLSAPEIVLNAARLFLRPIGEEGGPTLDNAALNIADGAEINTTAYGESRFYVPAGDIVVTGTNGAASVSETLTLAAGETVTRDFLIASGIAAIEGYYVEGMLMEGDGHAVSVLSAKKKIDGSREDFGTAYGTGEQFALPPGDYIARVRQNEAVAETPFSVKAGERVDVAVILNAGVLYASAPGASSIEVLEAKADISGNQTSLAFDYATEINVTVTAGDVLIRAKWDDQVVEQTATVTAGERTEVALAKP